MFKKYVFNKLNTITDFKNKGYKKENPKRRQIKVCFIDNEGFNVDIFKSTGYVDVDVKFDFSNPNELAAYDIIACDIDGIGLKLDKQRQGLAVAETIVAAYPEKVVLVYSAKNPFEYSKDFQEVGDGFFNKSHSNNEIAKEFDKYAAVLYDEIAAWKRIERRLRKDEVSNKTIAFIEDLYVRSLEDKVNLFDNGNFKKALGVAADTVTIATSILSVVTRFIG